MKPTSPPEIILLVGGSISLVLSTDKHLAAGIILISLAFYFALVRVSLVVNNLLTKIGDLTHLQAFLKQFIK